MKISDSITRVTVTLSKLLNLAKSHRIISTDSERSLKVTLVEQYPIHFSTQVTVKTNLSFSFC